MITFITLICSLVVLMIVGFIVNLYLYSRKAIHFTYLDVEEEDEAAEPPLSLHETIFV